MTGSGGSLKWQDLHNGLNFLMDKKNNYLIIYNFLDIFNVFQEWF